MWPTLLASLFGIIDKVIPDPHDAANAKLEAMKMQATKEGAELEASTRLALAQADTNKVEAVSNSLFVSGWRPSVGWTCALAFGFKYVGGPLLVMGCGIAGFTVQLPQIDAAELTPLLFGLLGLGAMRTTEKLKGVA